MRARAFLPCLAAAAAVAAAAPGAQDGQAIGWGECVREAWRQNPDLISALAKLGQSKADRRAAASPLFPQVAASARDSSSKGAGGDVGESHLFALDARQLLFDGLKTPFEMGRAGEGINVSRWAYFVASSDVRLRLRRAYVDLLRAQDLVVMAREIADRRKQNTDLVMLRYEAGREHRGSLMLSQADQAQADYNVASALRAIELERRNLTKEMGRPRTAPLVVVGGFTLAATGPEPPDFERLFDTNPFLRQLSARKEAARWGVKSAYADYFPTIYGSIGASKSGAGWPARGDEKNIGVTMNWPLFKGGDRAAGVAKSKELLRQSEADERSGRDGVVVTLTETWTALRNAVEMVEVQRKSLAAAEERAKISRAQYSIGLLSFDNWTIIEDGLVQAKNRHLDACWAEGRAEAAWVQALGGTLEDEL
jgi:outer membrane protein TolC